VSAANILLKKVLPDQTENALNVTGDLNVTIRQFSGNPPPK
jgi:hypothetical protein